MAGDRFPLAPPLLTEQEWIEKTDRPNRLLPGMTDRSPELREVDTALGNYERSHEAYSRAVARYTTTSPITDQDTSDLHDSLRGVADSLDEVSNAVRNWGPDQHRSRDRQGVVTDLVTALDSPAARALRERRDVLEAEREAGRADALARLEAPSSRVPQRRAAPPVPSKEPEIGGPAETGLKSHWSAASDVSAESSGHRPASAQSDALKPGSELKSEWYDGDSPQPSPTSEPRTPRAAMGDGNRPRPSGVPPSEVSIPSSADPFDQTLPDVPRSVASSPTSTRESGVPISALFGSAPPFESSG